jgi:scyllo-inositol 2-dehydrogenase (NADP+)
MVHDTFSRTKRCKRIIACDWRKETSDNNKSAWIFFAWQRMLAHLRETMKSSTDDINQSKRDGPPRIKESAMIRVGLAGFGMAGQVFHAPLISSVEGLKLAAVVERHTELAAKRYPGIATYRSLEAMLENASLELVVVATPSGSHFEIASQIFKAAKNVVIDKPMAPTSTEIAQLIKIALAQRVLLSPFNNRRWDSDFQTIHKVLHEGIVGRLVFLESTFDRWSPWATRRPWKDDDRQGGGILLDHGTHLADQALMLFGKPDAVSAEIDHEREGKGANDSFTLRLRYRGFRVTLAANSLSTLARPRFHLRGTKGNYWKWGVNSQEAALKKITHINDPGWGQEPVANWGTLNVDADGSIVTQPIKPVPGNYRLYYEGIRDALLGKAPAPATALEAWRVARLLEWGTASSDEHREIKCEWDEESQ